MAYKRRTDEEWLALIQKCKASGYSDFEWCKLNGIPPSTFYNKLNLLREKALLEQITKSVLHQQQAVVEVNFQDTLPQAPPIVNQDVALCLNLNGIAVNIFNNASKSTIENTLHALRLLC